MAAGRVPNVEGLDLEKAQVECSKNGVKVNDAWDVEGWWRWVSIV